VKNHIAVDDLPLAGGGPDVLEETVTLSKAVEGVVALTAGTDEAAESEGLVLAGVAAVLVNLADGDLDGGVVVGLDDAVGGAALAGHVAVERKVMSVVLSIVWLAGCPSSPGMSCVRWLATISNSAVDDFFLCALIFSTHFSTRFAFSLVLDRGIAES
jgi:hypothetical protein